ncbi:thioredoxin [Roseimarinus sediminis]|uniref:thioredoxin n=1 Tax=Roseimarinus sediminis TaxID=1610899 RepID=UPI003D190DCA
MKIVLLILGSLVVLFIALRWFAMRKIKNAPLVDDHQKIVTLSDKNFALKTKNKIMLVDFWAAWCAPCRLMAPVLNEVAENLEGNALVGKVDIEKYQSLAQQFRVRSIPTLILFKNGKEIKRFVGVKNKDFLINEIQKAQ